MGDDYTRNKSKKGKVVAFPGNRAAPAVRAPGGGTTPGGHAAPDADGKKEKRENKTANPYLEALISMAAILVIFDVVKFLVMQLILNVMTYLMSLKALPQTFSSLKDLTENGLFIGCVNLAGTLAAFSICFLLWKKDLAFKWTKKGGWITAAPFVLLAVCSTLGLNMLFSLLRLERFSKVFQQTAAVQAAVPVWLGLILYGIISPLAEETVFRGVIYRKARNIMPVPAAIAFSGVLFGIYHGNLVQGIYGGLLGCLMAWLYETDGSLLSPIVFHGIGNMAVYLMIDVWKLGDILGSPCLCAIFLAASAGSILLIRRVNSNVRYIKT